MGLSHSPNIVTDGLVLCLDAANRRSYPGAGTTWTDLSIDNNKGTLINGPTFATNNGGRIIFDGTNDYVEFTNPKISYPFPYTVVSIILWVFPLSSNPKTNGTNCNLITLERSFELSIGNKNNGYSSVFYASNPWQWRGNNGNHLINDKWNMLTFVHSLTDRKVYVGQELMYTYGDSGSLSVGSLNDGPFLRLMARYCCGGSHSPGSLSSVMMYNRTLSANEVQQNYNATRWRFQ